MLPTKEVAEAELIQGGKLNPGPWVDHSFNTGLAARKIAEKIPSMDAEKAYILGILHDIGRRVGIVSIPEHIIAGYEYSLEKGWDEVAKISMTHSYPLNGKEIKYAAEGNNRVIKDFLVECTYDDYDKLIILCDSLAIAQGFCLLEKRFVDVARRYGIWEDSVERWNATFAYKEYFESLMNCSIYDVLDGVKETSFVDI
jgi:hypothetical protein